jgi:choline dehydrogenase-like flavoprotein
MDLNPQPTPKMGVPARCLNCGRCVLGCPNGAKWDSRRFLDAALSKGADILTETAVEGVAIEGGEAKGVYARKGWRRRFFPVDLVVLAAGGLATPLILDASGIRSEPRLFVDPVLCVATRWDDAAFNKEIPMPFVVQMDRYILSPYFDYLSYFFNRRWKRPAENILSLMIKLSDDCAGSVSKRKVGKVFTGQDRSRLDEARRLCLEILGHLGVKEKDIFLGTINAGHPGGMLPLTRGEAESFHDPRLPRNVYVADATLFPASLGNPPILTIMAMAKRVCRICKEKFA